MNLLERVLTLLRANLNSMVERADDPERVLRQLQLDMRNQLMQVKTQVATAIAESHKLQKRSKEKMAEADTWLKKAEQAIQQNNDDAARAALTRYTISSGRPNVTSNFKMTRNSWSSPCAVPYVGSRRKSPRLRPLSSCLSHASAMPCCNS